MLHRGDVLDPSSLKSAGHGADVAYYLVNGMGRGSAGNFEERERAAARNFARMASEEGVARVVYVRGLGDRPLSRHLRSGTRRRGSSPRRGRRSPTSARRSSWGRAASRT